MVVRCCAGPGARLLDGVCCSPKRDEDAEVLWGALHISGVVWGCRGGAYVYTSSSIHFRLHCSSDLGK